MVTEAEFNQAFEESARINDGGWRDWFDPSIPPTDEPTPYPPDLVAKMLEADQVLWYNPGWVRELWGHLKSEAVEKGRLVWVRLKAEWLLSTLPNAPVDPDTHEILSRLSEGQFCEVYEGVSSSVDAGGIEFYLAHGQLNAARRVMEFERSILGQSIRDRPRTFRASRFESTK